MKGRTAAVAALTAVLLGGAPALAGTSWPAGTEGVLAVRAAHTASVQLVLREPARLDGERYYFQLPDRVIHASGEYGGLLVYRAHRLLFALVKDRDLPAPLVFGAPRITLQPGTYTVVVAGDGPVRVHLPLLDTSVRYRLRARDGAQVRRVVGRSSDTLPTSAATGNAGRLSTPLHVPQGSAIALAFAIRSDSQQLADNDLCLMPEDAPCDPRKEVEGMNVIAVSPGALGPGWQESAMFAYPGDIRAGHYYEVGDHAELALASDARLVGYVFG